MTFLLFVKRNQGLSTTLSKFSKTQLNHVQMQVTTLILNHLKRLSSGALLVSGGTWGFWYLPGSAAFHVAWTGSERFYLGSLVNSESAYSILK